jgi:hypothetical protein
MNSIPEGFTKVARALRPGLGAALGSALIAVACGACAPAWHEGPPHARWGENCVREVRTHPVARTINYVDPELCGRQVAGRSPYHVRTMPVPAPSVSEER